jgi:hypothetical protein
MVFPHGKSENVDSNGVHVNCFSRCALCYFVYPTGFHTISPNSNSNTQSEHTGHQKYIRAAENCTKYKKNAKKVQQFPDSNNT